MVIEQFNKEPLKVTHEELVAKINELIRYANSFDQHFHVSLGDQHNTSFPRYQGLDDDPQEN